MRKDLDDILEKEGAEALLHYSESFKDSNMYYLTKFLAPDPFIFLKRVDADPTIIINQMEHPRAQKQSSVKDVRSFADYHYLEVVKAAENPHLGHMEFVATVTEKELGKDTKIIVPPNFPAITLDVLREGGLTILPRLGIVEKARETKGPFETNEIKAVQRVAEAALTEAIALIANADVGPKGILYIKANGKKKPLTAGRIQAFVGHKFLDQACIKEEEIIVACGSNGADPHYTGEVGDQLSANQPIILDIYPRSIRKRYWTDMTRTIVKGRASQRVRNMFEAVREAKSASIDALHAGILGSDVHNLCCDVLEKAGYQTTRGGKKITRGFTHSLGHGVGLDLHEGPSLNELHGFPIPEQSIVTVEPGLYDPDVGGVRLEDIVEVTKTGCNNITKMEIALEV